MGATKYIVQDKVGFVEFLHCVVGSWTIVLGNDNKEDLLGVRTYQLICCEWNKLILHDALCTPKV